MNAKEDEEGVRGGGDGREEESWGGGGGGEAGEEGQKPYLLKHFIPTMRTLETHPRGEREGILQSGPLRSPPHLSKTLSKTACKRVYATRKAYKKTQ